jgi:hypothetical protein
MAIPLADIYQRTGFKLGVIRAEENLSAEDGDLVARSYEGLHDQLLSEGLMNWGVEDDVPEWAAPCIIDMLAAILVDEFGVEEPRRTTVKAEGILGARPVSQAERKLRRQMAAPYIPNVLPTEQF